MKNEEIERKMKAIENLLNKCIKEIQELKDTKAQSDLVAHHYIETQERIDNLEKIQQSMINTPNIIWKGYNKLPHKCPVCDTYGIHENGNQCHACKGKGIVWG